MHHYNAHTPKRRAAARRVDARKSPTAVEDADDHGGRGTETAPPSILDNPSYMDESVYLLGRASLMRDLASIARAAAPRPARERDLDRAGSQLRQRGGLDMAG
jgi:hypothetical protein